MTHAEPGARRLPDTNAQSGGMAPDAQPFDLSPAALVERHFLESADVRLDGVGKTQFPTDIRCRKARM